MDFDLILQRARNAKIMHENMDEWLADCGFEESLTREYLRARVTAKLEQDQPVGAVCFGSLTAALELGEKVFANLPRDKVAAMFIEAVTQFFSEQGDG